MAEEAIESHKEIVMIVLKSIERNQHAAGNRKEEELHKQIISLCENNSAMTKNLKPQNI